jgi:tetratricopeptide (TPR) repeat protein
LNLADVLARANQNEKALAVAGSLENEVYRGLIEARVAINRNEPALALEKLDALLPAWPNNPGARYWAARAAEQTGQFNRAIEEYRQAIRSSPGFSDAGLRLGLLHEAEGAMEDAWGAVFRYTEERPNDPDAAALKVRLASRGGPAVRLPRLLAYSRPLPVWPDVAAARARFLGTNVGPEAAVEAVRTGSQLDLTQPRNAVALEVLVDALVSLERTAEAQTAIDEALAADSESSSAHQIQGRLYAATGDGAAARTAFERAVELDPRNASAHLGLARLSAAAGDLEATRRHAERAATLDPGRRESYLVLAEALMAAGQTAQAGAVYRELLNERPFDSEAIMAWVRLRLVAGDSGGQTLEHARRAQRFGGGLEATRLLAEVYAQRGEHDLEKKVLNRIEATSSEPDPPDQPDPPKS